MNKLIAAIVMSTFALGSATSFAADATKQEELTAAQRAEMRNRADKLVAERAAAATNVKVDAKHTVKAKKHHTRKAKTSRHNAGKAQPAQ